MPFGTIKLNDGTEIPAIAYGTGTANRGKDVHDWVEQAIDTGFWHIDTAQFYENEDSVGIAIRESGLDRSDLYITTKWNGFDTPTNSLKASLTKLGIKHVDLYLIHSPTIVPNGDFEGAWKEFEKIKEDGLATSIGVSNFSVEDLQKLLKTARIKPAANQIQLHPYNHSENAKLLEYHAKHGIITEAYGSLAPITKFPGGPVDGPLADAAKRLGASPTQVLFLWVKAKNTVIVTTSSSKQHLQEYFSVGDLPSLTDEEVKAIDDAGAKGPLKLKVKAARCIEGSSVGKF
ncbi:Aldo/keto reductase [Cyathus striatus]|nr:Aldo/keto reductase [Cyathus striatus]